MLGYSSLNTALRSGLGRLCGTAAVSAALRHAKLAAHRPGSRQLPALQCVAVMRMENAAPSGHRSAAMNPNSTVPDAQLAAAPATRQASSSDRVGTAGRHDSASSSPLDAPCGSIHLIMGPMFAGTQSVNGSVSALMSCRCADALYIQRMHDE